MIKNFRRHDTYFRMFSVTKQLEHDIVLGLNAYTYIFYS